MTLVDSLDSVLMLYAYAGPIQDPTIGKFALTFKNDQTLPRLLDQDGQEEQDREFVPTLATDPNGVVTRNDGTTIARDGSDDSSKPLSATPRDAGTVPDHEAGPSVRRSREQKVLDSKANTISSLSITLTLLSILVALRYASGLQIVKKSD